MTLENLYMLSQILAVFFVAPSLIYLALQVRQNTSQLRAAARYQFVEASGQLNALIAGDKDTASVYRRGLENLDSLDDDERMQLTFFLGQFYQIYSVMFELHEDRLLQDSQWYNIRKDLLMLLRSPSGAMVWEEFGKAGFDPKFVAFLESLKESDEASYSLGGPKG